jgi:DNA-binding Lrp family transcriptional regulator
MHQQNNQQLNEGLRSGDLKDYVSEVFTVDRYSSKMGEDQDIVVLGFRVKEKNPAVDMMEFIERGFPFILDADVSAGEEQDGQYQVFVEIERTPQLAEQMRELLRGIGQLTDNRDWRFRYQTAPESVEFNEDSVVKNIPLTKEDYQAKVLAIKESDVKEFFNQGATDLTLDENNTITFTKPYAGDITAKFVAIGDYEDVKESVPGKLSLDESSQSQMLFLNKFLGNYDINKMGNKFLIRNGKRAVVIEKDRW